MKLTDLPTVLAVALAMSVLGGCVMYGARSTETTTTPAGVVTVREKVVNGGAVLSDRTIQDADVPGLGKLKGYGASPSVEAMRALGQGMGEAIGVAAKAAK
jgi:hypothetical protein